MRSAAPSIGAHMLPPETEILIGEPDAIGYDALQDELGYLIHGEDDWPTLRLPKAVAAAGAWAQDKLEPVIPDAIDEGEQPFIKPFMVAMADDHYALDIRRARELLGWEPRHRLKDELPRMVAALKNDPAGWYKTNARHAARLDQRRRRAGQESGGTAHPPSRRTSRPSIAPTAGRISSTWAWVPGLSPSRC